MKAERLIKILLLLQHGQTVTTRRMAEELEVSERTIHRDMESLSAAGLPIYAEKGRTGGWRLVDHWKQKLSWLKEQEMLALFLPPAGKIIQDLHMDDGGEDRIQKLLLSLPEQSKKTAWNVWSRIYVDMGTWKDGQEEAGPELDVLKKAVMEDRKVQMIYEKADGTVTKGTICPLGLIAKANQWYVAALNDKGEYRSYKHARVKMVTGTEETFERPVDFHLASYWEESKKHFTRNLPTYAATLRVSPEAYPRLRFTGRFATLDGEGRAGADGWVDQSLSFNTEEEAIGFVTGFGSQVKVIKPEALIEKIKARAQGILDLYK
ncbi:helix-turn-helix transcriptional regulator [Halobacillus litoralis]|uniref:helix-turn-helix transcriptional regulator n=1 Tax=Halobacillus litoralis TaxID=45668 RepID=UPI00136C69BC|nr:YafY family protein [Halobacillus litoralis]MYL39090.1 WYL domain-containing protein [Halobacillus litoralis]